MSAQPSIPRIRVAGCPVDAISFEQTVSVLCDCIERRRPTHVVFINAAKVVKYGQDPVLRGVIDRADLLLADGVPVVWASRLFGTRLPGRVNGTDLMESMVQVAGERGYSVYFLGARDNVLNATVSAFRARHAGLRVAGKRNGYFGPADEESVIDAVAGSGADLLLVGMSTPRKEVWVDKHLRRLGVSVAQGVGGSFDVVAGLVRRAPRWMQRYGLEWLFRLLQEPRRMWRRYCTTNAAFIWIVMREALRSRAAATLGITRDRAA